MQLGQRDLVACSTHMHPTGQLHAHAHAHQVLTLPSLSQCCLWYRSISNNQTAVLCKTSRGCRTEPASTLQSQMSVMVAAAPCSSARGTCLFGSVSTRHGLPARAKSGCFCQMSCKPCAGTQAKRGSYMKATTASMISTIIRNTIRPNWVVVPLFLITSITCASTSRNTAPHHSSDACSAAGTQAHCPGLASLASHTFCRVYLILRCRTHLLLCCAQPTVRGIHIFFELIQHVPLQAGSRTAQRTSALAGDLQAKTAPNLAEELQATRLLRASTEEQQKHPKLMACPRAVRLLSCLPRLCCAAHASAMQPAPACCLRCSPEVHG